MLIYSLLNVTIEKQLECCWTAGNAEVWRLLVPSFTPDLLYNCPLLNPLDIKVMWVTQESVF